MSIFENVRSARPYPSKSTRWKSFSICLFLLSTRRGVVGVAATPVVANDPYQPGRAIVADLDRIVATNGIQETFEATLGGARQVIGHRGFAVIGPRTRLLYECFLARVGLLERGHRRLIDHRS